MMRQLVTKMRMQHLNVFPLRTSLVRFSGISWIGMQAPIFARLLYFEFFIIPAHVMVCEVYVRSFIA